MAGGLMMGCRPLSRGGTPILCCSSPCSLLRGAAAPRSRGMGRAKRNPSFLHAP